MAAISDILLIGPDSEPFNIYAAQSPAPSGGPVTTASTPVNPVTTSFPATAIRGVRPMGTQLMLADGRKYRFALNGAATLVIGNNISSAAVLSTDQDMTPLTGTLPTGFTGGATLNERAITFTHGAATTVINFFAEGYCLVTITPGFADVYKIASHIALASAAAGDQINLWPGNAIRRVLTSSSRISLYQCQYSGVIQTAATITGAPVGVAISAPTAGQFCWLQTRGPAGVLGVGTLTIGSPAVALLSGGTAGAAAPSSASTQPIVGMVLGVEATTQASLLDLRMDG